MTGLADFLLATDPHSATETRCILAQAITMLSGHPLGGTHC